MWWWNDSGWTAFWMLEMIGALWLLIVFVVLGIDRMVHARKTGRVAKSGPEETTVPVRATDASDATRTAA